MNARSCNSTSTYTIMTWTATILRLRTSVSWSFSSLLQDDTKL
jgi:hypothetical protein